MKGRNDPTAFLPLKPKIGGPARYAKDRENMCLTADQPKYIYKKVEQKGIINVQTFKQQIEDDKLNKGNTDNEKEVNPYQNIILNEFDRENIIASQMEQWSILSNVVNYVQYDRNPRDFYNLNVKAINQKIHSKIHDRLKEEDRQVIEIDFGDTLDKFKGKYLDMYDRVKSEVLSTIKFDENSDLSTTYLGRINMTRLDKLKQKKSFLYWNKGIQ